MECIILAILLSLSTIGIGTNRRSIKFHRPSTFHQIFCSFLALDCFGAIVNKTEHVIGFDELLLKFGILCKHFGTVPQYVVDPHSASSAYRKTS